MKIIHTSMLLPVLLGGCSLPGHRSTVSDAREFVDAQISLNQPLIEQAQKNLLQASSTMKPVRLPSTTSPPGVIPGAPPATGQLRGLTNIKSLGSPEPFTVISIRQQNLQLESMLYKVVPPGWSVIISANIKKDFRQRIALEANDQWPYVLDGLMARHGWVALIDWSRKQVSVADQTPAFTTAPSGVLTTTPTTATHSTSPRNPFSQSRAEESKSMSVKQGTRPLTPAVVPAPPTPPKVWRIEPGTTLKDTLFNWAAAEKCAVPGVNIWTVAWLTPVNYRVDAPLQFKGDFRSALNGLFTLYGSAKVPLYAGVRSEQCVISVDDKEIR